MTDTETSYLRLPEKSTWPNPNDPREVQWRLRYGTPSREDLLFAASTMAAYSYLLGIPQRRRCSVVAQIRKALG